MRSEARLAEENAIDTRPDRGHGARWSYSKRGYALAHSLRQLKRYRIASLGTLFVLGITLSLPTILYFSSSTFAALSQRSAQGESLTAYLDVQVSDLDGAELAKELQSRADIRKTSFISSDQAMDMLAQQSDIQSAIELLGRNPLPGSIVIYPVEDALDATRIQTLADTVNNMTQITRVQLDLRWVQRLEAAVALLKWIGGLLALFLTLTALLVIVNTIRLEISRRRSEMDVANLLGASSHFMNRPILYTGALYGFLGGIIACVIALLTLNAIRAPADDLSALYQSAISLTMPAAEQILIALAVSVALGLAGAACSLYQSSRQLTH
jgi:cell division transport system permease protein